MQIGSRFTIGVHIITAIDYFKDMERVNSEFLAGSIGVNPVIVRTVISQLREAGILQTKRGSSGAEIAKRLNEITLYDIYKAVGSVDMEGIFISMSSRIRTALWGETSIGYWISISLMRRELWKRNSEPQRLPILWKTRGKRRTMNKKRSNLS